MSNDDAGEVKVLEYSLYIASIQRRNILTYLPVLIEQFFLKKPHQRFVSFTETEDEISMILDEESIDAFEKFRREVLTLGVGSESDSLLECPTCWRGIVVSNGQTVEKTAKIVKSLSSCLSERDISIMYVSLFDSELVLVEEEKLDLAISHLKQLFQQSSDQEINDEDEDAGVREEEQHLEEPKHIETEVEEDQTMHATLLENVQLQAIRFTSDIAYQYFISTMLDVLFYRSCGKTPYLSFTSFDNNNILVAGSEILQRAILNDSNMSDQVQLLHDFIYTPVRIDEGALGFEETGITAKFSGSLGTDIPILYNSTFLTDFCIINSADLATAVSCLQRSNFIIN